MSSQPQPVAMQSMLANQNDPGKLSDMQVPLSPERLASWSRNPVGGRTVNHTGRTVHLSIANNNNNNDCDDSTGTSLWVAEVSLVSSDEETVEVNAEQTVREVAAAPVVATTETGDDIVFVASVVRTPVKGMVIAPDELGRAATTNGLDTSMDVDHNTSRQCPENVNGVDQRLSNGVVAIGGPAAGRIRSESGPEVAKTKSCPVSAFYRQTPALPTSDPPLRIIQTTKPCLRERKTVESSTAAAVKKTKDASTATAPVNGSPRSPSKSKIEIVTAKGARMGRNPTRISRELFNGDGQAAPAAKRPKMNGGQVTPSPQQKSSVSPGSGSDKNVSGSVLDSPRRIVPPGRWMTLMDGSEVAVVTSKRNVSPVAAVAPPLPSTTPVLKKRRGMWKRGLVAKAKKKKTNDVKVEKTVATTNSKNGKESPIRPLVLPPGIDQAPVDGTMTPPPSSSSCSGEANSPVNTSAAKPKAPHRRSSDAVEVPTLQKLKKNALARAEKAKLAAVLHQLCPGKKKVSCELRDIYEHSVNSAKLAARKRPLSTIVATSTTTTSRSASTSPRAKVPMKVDTWWEKFSEISASPRIKRAPLNATTTHVTATTTKVTVKSKVKMAPATPPPTKRSPVVNVHSPTSTIMQVSRGIFTDKTKNTRQNAATSTATKPKKGEDTKTKVKTKKKAGDKSAKTKLKGKVMPTRITRNVASTTDSSKKRAGVVGKVAVKNKKAASLSSVAAKKKRVAINRQLALGNKTAQGVTKSVRRSASPAATTTNGGRKNGGKVKPDIVELSVLTKPVVGLPRKLAARLVKVEATRRSASPAPINVKNLVKVANDLLILSSTSSADKSPLLAPSRTKGANKTRTTKNEKPLAGASTKPSKANGKESGKRTKKLSTEVGKLDQPGRANSNGTHERMNGVQSAKAVRPQLSLSKVAAVAQRRSASPAVQRPHQPTGNGRPGVGGYNGGSHGSNAIKRSSVRQAECSFRYREIGVKRHSNFIQIVLISNTRVRNGLNAQVLFELQMVLQAARTDPKCRLVVLNGTGGVFCSGVDLISLSNDQGPATAEKMSNAVRDFCKALLTFPKPLVAAVNGSAVGLGVTFLPFFDIVYASDKATFYTPYCKLGQIPECGATITFPSVMGYAKANGLLLEGQRLTATEALSTGLITQVLWPATFMEEVIPRVQAMANYPIDAVMHTKALIRYHSQSKLEVTLDTECRVLLQQWSSNVCRQAIRDFLRNEEVV